MGLAVILPESGGELPLQAGFTQLQDGNARKLVSLGWLAGGRRLLRLNKNRSPTPRLLPRIFLDASRACSLLIKDSAAEAAGFLHMHTGTHSSGSPRIRPRGGCGVFELCPGWG